MLTTGASTVPVRAQVREAYAKPVVDISTAPCEWGRPDLHGLRAFCSEKFGCAAAVAVLLSSYLALSRTTSCVSTWQMVRSAR